MSNPEALKAQLEIIPPGSKIELAWTDDEPTQTEGRIVDYNPHSAARRIETETRTLLVTPSVDESELTVCELTADQPRSLGELQTISLIEHAIETLEVTPKGVDVPSYLVSYSGFLVIETNEKKPRTPDSRPRPRSLRRPPCGLLYGQLTHPDSPAGWPTSAI